MDMTAARCVSMATPHPRMMPVCVTLATQGLAVRTSVLAKESVFWERVNATHLSEVSVGKFCQFLLQVNSLVNYRPPPHLP